MKKMKMTERTIKRIVIHYSDDSTETIGDEEAPSEQPRDYSLDDMIDRVKKSGDWWFNFWK